MHRKAEEESHSGVLWATTRTQRGAAWAAHTSSDVGCSTLGVVLVLNSHQSEACTCTLDASRHGIGVMTTDDQRV